MKENKPLLVVDLDGTLIRSDMLYETFWSAFSSDWTVPFKALGTLFSGRAKLKSYLYQASDLDISLLPYNQSVIDYIIAYRKEGGKVALVTASYHKLAEEIADYLGIFDEVHGSNETLNLKGKHKAKFISEHFKDTPYIYMGDSAADIPVWENAEQAITVNASKSVQSSAEKVNQNTQHISGHKPLIMDYLKAWRPHQWLKNVLVFLPIFAAHRTEIELLIYSIVAFISFSFVASSVYIINDLLDLNADRSHPRKKKRPFAAGIIPINSGMLLALCLFMSGSVCAFVVNPLFLCVLMGYFILTFLYSLYLKRKAIIDIFTLAGLYTIRIVGGAVATNIELSFWLLAFSIFIFLSLAAVKRQAELVDLTKRDLWKIQGRGYRADDLPMVTMIALSSGFMSVLVMALYLHSPEVIELYRLPSALWGVCALLLYWICRMVFKTHRGKMNDDPIVFAIKDKFSLLNIICIFILVVVGTIWQV